jgi:hypothetical protein
MFDNAKLDRILDDLNCDQKPIYELPENYIVDEDVEAVMNAIDDGVPVIYVAGKAGVGKSSFINYLRNNTKKQYITCSPTGVAALNIKAATIHSTFYFPGKFLDFNKDIKPRYDGLMYNLELLILDEVGSISSNLMDAMDYALRKWRNSHKPFGGVQVLMVGDIFQIPAVQTKHTRPLFEKYYKSAWFFDANVFKEVEMTCFEFKKIYRQNEKEFIMLLNNVRNYVDIDNTIALLNEKCVKKGRSDIQLTPTNALCDSINSSMMESLEGEEKTYYGIKSGNMTLLDNNLPVPEILTLKTQAKVMVRKNIDGAVNGSLGYVEEMCDNGVYVKLDTGNTIFITSEKWTTYKYKADGDKIVSEINGQYSQIPLILGWVITFHKSQSLSLDRVRINVGRGCHDYHMLYTALSRCRTLEGLSFSKPISKSDIMIDPLVVRFYQERFGVQE